MMVGDPSVPTIANVFLCQQVFLCQFILCAIGGGALFIPLVARQRVAIEAINHIAECRVQLVRRNVATIDMGQLLSRKLAAEMASHLVWAQIRSIGENGEQLPLKRIGDFRLIARKGTEMAAKAGQVMHTDQDIEQMAFGDFLLERFLQLRESAGLGFGWSFLENGFAFVCDDQLPVFRSGAIDLGSHLGEPGPQVIHKALGGHGEAEPLTVFSHFRLALLP